MSDKNIYSGEEEEDNSNTSRYKYDSFIHGSKKARIFFSSIPGGFNGVTSHKGVLIQHQNATTTLKNSVGSRKTGKTTSYNNNLVAHFLFYTRRARRNTNNLMPKLEKKELKKQKTKQQKEARTNTHSRMDVPPPKTLNKTNTIPFV